MTSMAASDRPERRVSIWLGAGVLFVPLIFAWFLLRKGYSNTVRGVGLSWMALTTIAAMLQPDPAPSEQIAKAENSNPAVQSALVQPAKANSAKAPSSSASQSSELELKRLYEQLQGFRRDPAFLDVGFDLCCRFNAWLQNVRSLRDRDSSMTINGQRVVTGELETLAFQYMNNGGRSTEMASFFERQFEYALYPPKRVAGRGIVIEDTRGCRNFELVAQFFRLSEEGAYAASDAVLHGPGCEKVGVGTRIGPVLARQSYRYRNGKTSDHVLVALPNGRKVWLWDGEIEFH